MAIEYTNFANKSVQYNYDNGDDANKWDYKDYNAGQDFLLNRSTMAGLFNVIGDPSSLSGEFDIIKLLERAGETGAVKDKPSELKTQAKQMTEKLKILKEAKQELAGLAKKEEQLNKKIADLESQVAAARGRTKRELETQLQKAKGELRSTKEASATSAKVLKSLISKAKAVRKKQKAMLKAEKAKMAMHKPDGSAPDAAKFDAAKAAVAELEMPEFDEMYKESSEAKQILDKMAAQKPGAKGKAAGSGSSQTSGNAPGGAAQAQTPQANGKAAGATPSAAGKAAGGGNPFDPNSMWAMNQAFDNRASAMDEVFKMQGNSNKMMMLLLYLSRMAMSGDIGAMYRFMQFVATIVQRDKAAQNVQLADKLIKLQGVSRALTQQLVDTPSYDKDDPNVQAEFQKMMETIKADQGMIATEQKMIASMLEEMAQISEQMWNLQKSLLDVNGNIMKNSRFG